VNTTKRMVLVSGGAIALVLVVPGAVAGGKRTSQPTRMATMTCRQDGGSPILNPGTVHLASVSSTGFKLNLSNCGPGRVHFLLPDGGFGSPFTRSVYWYDAGVGKLDLTQPNPTPLGSYEIQFMGQLVSQATDRKDPRCPKCVDEAPGSIRVSTSGSGEL